MTLGPCSAYGVDIFHDLSAESIAASSYVFHQFPCRRLTIYFSGFRSLVISIAVTAILPMINTIGIVATNTLSALVTWVGFL